MTEEQSNYVASVLSGIKVIVAPESKITLLMNSILLLEIYLKPGIEEHKVFACHTINQLLKMIQATTTLQLIIAVMNDDDDKYVRLIGEGIEGKELEFPE